MSSNPLENINKTAQSAVLGVMNWAASNTANPFGFGKTSSGGKEDPVLQSVDMDTLRRAAYGSLFTFMFKDGQEYPIVTPDKTLKNVVGKLASNIYPTDTKYSLPDAFKENNDLLTDIMNRSGFDLKVEGIIEESAVMGYCGLRSVWLKEAQRWLLEIIPKERLVIESQPDLPEEITAIQNYWSRKEGKRTYWRKERWTDTTYEIWPELPEKFEGVIPLFEDEYAELSVNTYGEIPITLVPHVYKTECYGVGIIQREEFLIAKDLVTLRNKRFYAHIKYMQPIAVRINARDKSIPINLGIGGVVDIGSDSKDSPADLKFMETQGIPETAKEEIIDWVCELWRSADLKPPPPDGHADSTGGRLPTSGVALRIIDKDDAKTITTLRKNGYAKVIRHYEKLLRFGRRLALTGYEFINPDDATTYTITANYPDFFPPTDDDIAIQLANMKSANLPVMVQAKRIAALFGIEDDAEIQEIADNIQAESDMQKASIMGTGGFGG